jgi:hypothetical protein
MGGMVIGQNGIANKLHMRVTGYREKKNLMK